MKSPYCLGSMSPRRFSTMTEAAAFPASQYDSAAGYHAGYVGNFIVHVR
jgi:hypothetical protein